MKWKLLLKDICWAVTAPIWFPVACLFLAIGVLTLAFIERYIND